MQEDSVENSEMACAPDVARGLIGICPLCGCSIERAHWRRRLAAAYQHPDAPVQPDVVACSGREDAGEVLVP